MAKRILLVDDEVTFVKALKVQLNHLSALFETDICSSVSEAIKLLKTKEYNLIITDIKMPEKSGIDLLLHLRAINFSGGIKVMSAYSTEENIKKINSLGVVDLIPKPLNLDWFESMIVDYFEKEKSIVFESIDLFTVMQAINLDNKSTTLNIDINGKQGIIYFQGGEIINAEYENLKGEEALIQLMILNKGDIYVKKAEGQIARTINKPFLDLCAELLLITEEKKSKENKGKNKIPLRTNKSNKETKMARIKDVLKTLNDEVSGLQVASIFGKDGIPVTILNPANLDVDAFSAKFAIVGTLVSKTIRDLSGGTVSEILIEEDNGWTLVRPIGKTGLLLLIGVSSEATLGNVRLVAKNLAAKAEKQ